MSNLIVANNNPRRSSVGIFTAMPHQMRAFNNITEAFETGNRTQYISACGTGKTFVGYEYTDMVLNEEDEVVLFFPSLALMNQTYQAYLNYGLNVEERHLIFICSDKTVSCSNEEYFDLDGEEISFPVTTEEKDIISFLEQSHKKRLIFCTYNSSITLSDAFNRIDRNIPFALYDEAHKTASESDSFYSYTLDDNNIKIDKRLFMTATPKHRKLRSGEVDEELYSMDNEKLYGKVADKYSLREAINDGVVAPYKIIISVMDSAEIELIRKNSESNLIKNMSLQKASKVIAFSKAVNKYRLNKGIVFAERIDRSIEYCNAYDEINAGFNIHLDSRKKSSEIYTSLRYFSEAKKGMVFNARLFSEGIDLPSISVVSFMEKTESVINIAQRIGRATRKDRSNPNKIGYIFLPIFLSDANEDIYCASKNSGDFNEMLEIINVLAEQDDSLYSVFANSKKEPEKSKALLDGFITIEDHTGKLDMSKSESLKRKIKLLVLDNIGYSWDKFYELLGEYRKKKKMLPRGHTLYKGFHLGAWFNAQRALLYAGNLSKQKTILLDNIDPKWRKNAFERKWHSTYEVLVEYFEEFKKFPLTKEKYKGIRLGEWFSNQRVKADKGVLKQEYIDKLKKLSPFWQLGSHEIVWETSFEAFKGYHDKHQKIPIGDRAIFNDIHVGGWIYRQRKLYKKGKLSKERIKKLDSVNENWKNLDSK